MTDFYVHQRYTSSGEPELGVGIVTEVSKNKVAIYFPLAHENRLYAKESAPLIRTVFKVGDTLSDKNGHSIFIEEVLFEEPLYIYVGNGRQWKESEIAGGTTTHSLEDRLFSGEVDSPSLFALRRHTLYHDFRRRTSPVHGFVGGKIDLIPHQLYIAHEVSTRFAPRVLLSDQVGLGKTIEACLILHRLLVTGRISRALILVPESLMHQWFVEMLRKFNLWFHIFDEERCASLEESAPEGNPFLDDQLIICSVEFLANSPKRSQQAIAAGWDMLVVDEAHHLEWSEEEVSPSYRIVELLSQAAKGLLLLTATPEQLGVESHFARLRLLDPNRYNDYNEFLKESKGNKETANLVEKIASDQTLNSQDYKLLGTLFPNEPIEILKEKIQSERNHLIEDVLDQYGPGRILFRNTRATMKNFPKRIVHIIPLEVKEDFEVWMNLSRKEFFRDVKNSSEKTQEDYFYFNEDPRVEWVLKKMEEIYPSKIVLICNSKEKVLALESAIRERIKINVGVFHEDLTLVQRDRNAAWFADHDSSQILLCSEIGSEGRNFQFAHHLILFDVPFQPELLEQRIGRLDRIGQKEDINIHVPHLNRSPQSLWIRWLHEGLNAFESNVESGNNVLKVFGSRLIEIYENTSFEEATLELEKLIIETQKYQKKIKENVSQGRDILVELNSFRPQIAEEIRNQILSEDKNPTLENYLTKVFQYFDMEMEDLATRTYLLHPSSMSAEAFPSIPREGIQITFDRERAIRRDDIGFLTWEHPITTTAIDKVLSSNLGSVSFGILKENRNPGILLELIFILETAGAESIDIDRFLPNTPIRIVMEHTGVEVTKNYPAETFNRIVLPGNMSILLENETFVEVLLPKMISTATEIAQEKAEVEITKGMKSMHRTLDHEIQRLISFHEKYNHIRPDEILTAIEEKKYLTHLIQKARIRLDALLLIRRE